MNRYRAPHTKRTPIRAASPTLKRIFEEMTERGMRVQDMADELCKASSRVSEWRRGAAEPGIMTVEEMAMALGYRLVLEKVEDPQ